MQHADNPLVTAALDLVSALAEIGITPTFIGGVAVSLIAKPRYTDDLDALIVFDPANADTLLDNLANHGFMSRFEGMAELARRSRMVTIVHENTETVVDIVLGCMPFEIELQERAVSYGVAGVDIRIATPEDLVILKAVTNRPKDKEDIRNIAQICLGLDRNRIRYWVEQFAELLETPGLLLGVESLLSGEAC